MTRIPAALAKAVRALATDSIYSGKKPATSPRESVPRRGNFTTSGEIRASPKKTASLRHAALGG
jgi:hypothetical protein